MELRIRAVVYSFTLIAFSLVLLVPAEADQTAFTIGIERLEPSGILVVPLKFPKGDVGLFVWDTGSVNSFIDAGFSEQAGLRAEPYSEDGKAVRLPINDNESARSTTAAFNLGPVPVRLAMFVVKTNKLSQVFGRKIDGILGMSLIETFAFRVSASKREMRIWLPGKLTDSDIRTAGMDRADVIPLSYRSGRLKLNVNLVDNKHAKLVVDLGSQHTFLTPMIATKIDLKPTQKHVSQATVYGISTVDFGVLDQLGIGATVVEHINVGIRQSRLHTDNDGSLGLDVLGRFSFLIDTPGGKLYLLNDN